ncbi:MAG: hypothetical protein ACI9UT_000564, partial [Flavobacteriales bacterium]
QSQHRLRKVIGEFTECNNSVDLFAYPFIKNRVYQTFLLNCQVSVGAI